MTEFSMEDIARCQLLSEKPLEIVIAGTHAEYNTYLFATHKTDHLDAEFTDRRDGLFGRHMDTIVLLGDRWSASPAYNGIMLKFLSSDNIIVEKSLSGKERRYWYAAE